jgi:predicted amidohydrolase
VKGARVAIVELPARFGEPDRAFAELDALLAAGPRADLVLVPETAFTGYVSPEGDFDLSPFAEPLEGPTLAKLRDLARRHATTLAAPIVERSGARLFNAFVAVDPAGEIAAHYRKLHPWYPEAWAAPGDLPRPSFDAGGARFTIAICFDVHFLEDESAGDLDAADALLFPSAWVDDGPEDARAELLGGIARRHGVAILNANWGPGAPRVRGQGASRAVVPAGEAERVASAPDRVARIDAIVRPRRAT